MPQRLRLAAALKVSGRKGGKLSLDIGPQFAYCPHERNKRREFFVQEKKVHVRLSIKLGNHCSTVKGRIYVR